MLWLLRILYTKCRLYKISLRCIAWSFFRDVLFIGVNSFTSPSSILSFFLFFLRFSFGHTVWSWQSFTPDTQLLGTVHRGFLSLQFFRAKQAGEREVEESEEVALHLLPCQADHWWWGFRSSQGRCSWCDEPARVYRVERNLEGFFTKFDTCGQHLWWKLLSPKRSTHAHHEISNGWPMI